MTVPPVGHPQRAIACRALILTPPPQPPAYPLSNLDTRRLRLLAMWESEEALKLAQRSGLEVPHGDGRLRTQIPLPKEKP